jgi:hypothetical protein
VLTGLREQISVHLDVGQDSGETPACSTDSALRWDGQVAVPLQAVVRGPLKSTTLSVSAAGGNGSPDRHRQVRRVGSNV